MYLKEFENIEVILNNNQSIRWTKQLGFNPEPNKSFLVHWSILITKKFFRNQYLKIKCDNCDKIIERRLIKLDPNIIIHHCKSCSKKGEKNPMFGKPINDNFKKSNQKLMLEKGNPFTWDSTKEILKSKQIETTKKVVEKNTGKKRTSETCKKMSIGMCKAYKDGKMKIGNGFTNIPIKQYKNIDYQGTYELRFLKFIETLNKLDLIQRGPKISYYIDDVEHNYFIDYMIKDTDIVFEIKSNYYWEKSEKINILKRDEAMKLFNYNLILDNNFKQIEKLFD
jgi:hypothetical protein